MPATQKRPIALSAFLWHCVLLTGLLVCGSCASREPKQTNTKPAKSQQLVHDTGKDSFAPPIVIPITSANRPIIKKAGKPTITIDSSNIGAPFFTNYTTDQGLPINFITACIQDKEGNIWVGTGGGGLVKYNGKNFTTYTTAQGLSDDFIEAIMQDKAGNIWLGTIGNGVSMYNGKFFSNYSTSEGLAGNLVKSIVQDNNSNMWFATDKGASMYNGKTFTNFTAAQGLVGNKVESIMKDKSGDLWFGCSNGGISRYNGKSFTNYGFADGLPATGINGMMEDKNGNIWITTFGFGATRYDGKSFTNYSIRQGLVSNDLLRSMQDKDGNIWFSSPGYGVSIYNGKTFTNYTATQGLPENGVLNIMQDKAGRIWLGTFKGLIAYDGKAISSYKKLGGIQHILKDKAGKCWFSGFGSGLTSYDGKVFSNLSAMQGLISNAALYSMQDKDGNIWVGTSNGASRYDGKSFTNYSSAQGLNASVNCLLQDSNGNIWFGSNSGTGVYKFDGNSFTNYTTKQGLIGNYVNCMIQDKKGDIWFGANDGISRYNGKQFVNYTTIDGLAANSAYSCIQDSAGNIWFGSGADGVSIYDGNHFIKYTTTEGLADNTVAAVAEDAKRKMIWFGTNQGLSGLKKSMPLDKNFPAADIFNISTGYPIKNFNGNALLVDDKGIIWAGCETNSLIRFDYDAINKNMQPLSLQIENIKLNGKKICWNDLLQNEKRTTATDSLALINEMVSAFGKVMPAQFQDSIRKEFSGVQLDSITPFYSIPVNLVVPYENRDITFDFAAIEPDKPKQVKYQYMLEGYSDDWSPMDNNTTAVFGNIPGGKYTFRLKALSPYGVWSETSYNFTVLPPWWKTWWAYTIYTIFFIAIFVLIGWSIQRRLLKKERQLNQLRELEMQALRAQMNPHFIFNCLTSINRFVLMNETEAASDYLTKFSRLIRTVLNNSKKSFISLEDELETLRLYLDMEKLRFNNGFEYHVQIDDQVEIQNIFIPPLLFQPFAENAVWHGLMHKNGAGKLNIRLSVEDNILNFVMEDNGVGRGAASSIKSNSAEKNKSMGLQITKDRLSLINGHSSEKAFFEIRDLYDEAGNGAGTIILLKIRFSETQDGYSN